MSRFLTIAAVAALLPLGQPPVPPRPIIDWQQVAAPFGGEAEVVLPHGDVLLVRSVAHSLNRWWLSSDHGATWQIAAGQLGEAWWVMPHGPDVFIISSSGGVQRTSDLGRSWIPCSRVGAHREDQGRLLPAGKSLLYWISNVGLFRSEDRCATWTPVKVPWNLDEWGLWAVLAPDAGVLLVHPSHKWFRSTDEGQSWEVVSGPGGAPLPAASGGRPSFVFGTDLVLGTTNGVFRSTDRGLSWSPIGLQGQWTRATTTRDGDIYTALDGKESTPRTKIMRSPDGGKTWLSADDGLQGHHIRDLKRDAAGTVYAAGDAGLYRLEAMGRWQHVGFATFFPSSLFGAPWGDVYLGADYGDAYRSRDRGVTWQPLLLPAGYKHAGSITATARGDLLMATSTALLRSRDRGDTWEAVQAENLEAENEILTLFTVPSTGTIVGGRRDGVIRSDDGGQTWVKHSAGAFERVVPSTFADRGNGELIVGTADGALYRLPGAKGTLWPLPPHGGAAVTSLAVLANGDVLAGTTSGLLRLRPTGDEWEAVSLSREEEPHVTALIVHPRGHLVVATSAGGVLISNGEGRTWWPANQGLATRHVRRMALGADGELYIATGTDGVNYGDSAPGGRLRVYRGRISIGSLSRPKREAACPARCNMAHACTTSVLRSRNNEREGNVGVGEFAVDCAYRLRSRRSAWNRDRGSRRSVPAKVHWGIMNREWVLFNLREAEEELRRTIAEIESKPDYGSGEFFVAVTHAYHHLNSAWNARDESEVSVEACAEEDFMKWRQFPRDIYLGP